VTDSGLETGPEFRHVVQRQRLGGDAHALDLVLQARIRRDSRKVRRTEQRVIVQQDHGLPQQFLPRDIVIGLAVGGHQVLQHQGQRRMRLLALAALVRHRRITKGAVVVDAVKKDVDLVAGIARAGGGGRFGRDGRRHGSQQVLQGCGNGCDGGRAAHRCLPLRFSR
jgi:hypothetical protein